MPPAIQDPRGSSIEAAAATTTSTAARFRFCQIQVCRRAEARSEVSGVAWSARTCRWRPHPVATHRLTVVVCRRRCVSNRHIFISSTSSRRTDGARPYPVCAAKPGAMTDAHVRYRANTGTRGPLARVPPPPAAGGGGVPRAGYVQVGVPLAAQVQGVQCRSGDGMPIGLAEGASSADVGRVGPLDDHGSDSGRRRPLPIGAWIHRTKFRGSSLPLTHSPSNSRCIGSIPT